MCEKFEEKIILTRKGKKLENEVVEHISTCPTCRVLLKNSVEVDNLLEKIEDFSTSNDFNQKVFSKIEKIEGEKFEIEKRRLNIKVFQMAAASFLLFLSLFLTGINLNRTKKELPYSISDLKQEKILEEVEMMAQSDEDVLSTYNEWNINN